jgi:MOSC domain-containing protein
LFDFRGRVRRRPQDGSQDSPVRITLPDGTELTSGQPDLEQILSGAFGRDVAFEEARPGQMRSGATAEESWPDIAGLD